jgi:hypothetical protein
MHNKDTNETPRSASGKSSTANTDTVKVASKTSAGPTAAAATKKAGSSNKQCSNNLNSNIEDDADGPEVILEGTVYNLEATVTSNLGTYILHGLFVCLIVCLDCFAN